MFKKTVTYTDYDGLERTEDFYFDLSKSELIKMEASEAGGYTSMLNKIIAAKDGNVIIRVFSDLLYKAYGEKSPDGKRFMKSDAISDAFVHSAAYDVIFMELVTDADKAAEFANKIMPKDLVERAEKENAIPMPTNQ